MSKSKDPYIFICPRCKSPDVVMDKSNPLQPALGLPPVYVCNKCGYSSYVFPEIKLSELEDFKKDVKEEDEEEDS
jgi:transposase-like protein